MKVYYQSLYKKCGEAMEAMYADEDCARAHAASHNFLADLEELANSIAGRPEQQVFAAAVKELEFALLALALGLYRQAYAGLRLFLELVCATVWFSGSELELRHWLSGKQHIVWSTILDDKGGIFSERFVGAFFPELVGRANQFKTLSNKLHLECSQYVHGSALTHSMLPTELLFNREVCLDWNDKADTAHLITLFAYCSRYLNDMGEAPKSVLEPIVSGSLHEIEPIRLMFVKKAN